MNLGHTGDRAPDYASVVSELEAIMNFVAERPERARLAAEVIRRAGSFHWVGLYDVGSREITAIAWTGSNAPAFPRFSRTEGLNGVAVSEGQTVVVNDVARDPRYLTTFGSTRAEMIVPVRAATGVVVGTVDVESEKAGAFGYNERALVERCSAALLPLWTTYAPPAS
jgi:GAF domain-containing protein